LPPATILLVNTNRMRPPIAPLALDYLGAALRVEGHQVRLLDLCWAEDANRAACRAFAEGRPDLVALTFRNTDDCYFASRASFVDVLRADIDLIRQHYDGPIVVGGCGFSLMPTLLLDHAGADYGVRSDGEPALGPLLDALQGGPLLAQVPGLVYRHDGAWRKNPPGRAVLERLSLAARDVVDNRAYFAQGGQVGIETKRGCPGRCIYCADPVVKGHTPRLRPPADVVAEIRCLLAQGVDCLHLCDSEFNLPEAHAIAVCQAILGAGLQDRVRWYTYAAPVPFSRELAALMRRAGCVGVNFGADSGNDRMLAALGRDHRARDLAETARVCRQAGLVFMYDLLLGAPGETPQSVAETIALMKHLSPDRVGISLGVRVYPGTRLARQLAASPGDCGLIGNPASLEPSFYLSPALGPDAAGLVRDLVGDDARFFLPAIGGTQDYNYNDNAVLVHAIAAGHRGAYWDILRRLQAGLPPLSHLG